MRFNILLEFSDSLPLPNIYIFFFFFFGTYIIIYQKKKKNPTVHKHQTTKRSLFYKKEKNQHQWGLKLGQFWNFFMLKFGKWQKYLHPSPLENLLQKPLNWMLILTINQHKNTSTTWIFPSKYESSSPSQIHNVNFPL